MNQQVKLEEVVQSPSLKYFGHWIIGKKVIIDWTPSTQNGLYEPRWVCFKVEGYLPTEQMLVLSPLPVQEFQKSFRLEASEKMALIGLTPVHMFAHIADIDSIVTFE